MPILPYCVVEEIARVNVPDTGVAGAPISELNESGMRCFFSELDGVPKDIESIRAMALQFQKVIQEIFSTATAIPFRFVTLLRGEDELRDFLEEHADKFVSALERLEGCVQFEFHLVRRQAAPEPLEEPASGTEYLKGKKAAVDVFKATSESLRKAAGDLAISWRLNPGDDDARCYALVEREKSDDFKKALGKAKLAGELRVVVSGPWPPSEFVG